MHQLFVIVSFLFLISFSDGLYFNKLPIRTNQIFKKCKNPNNIQMCDDNNTENNIPSASITSTTKEEMEVKSNNPFQRLLKSFKKSRESSSLKGPNLKELGLYALLSYGFVSNFSYVTTVICAWVIHGKTSGLSPLAEGQWKQFGAIYLSIYAVNNLLRPLRMSVAVALAPAFDKMILSLQNRFNIGKSKATGLLVFLVNVLGTFSYLFFGLAVVTKIAGVPLLA